MEVSAGQIAALLNGKVEGDSNVVVNNISKIEEGREKTITFLANLKFEDFIYSTKASIVIVNNDFVPKQKINSTIIKVPDAYKAFVTILEFAQKKKIKTGINSLAFVANTAKIEDDVYIDAFAYIGENAVVGKNVKIYPHVFIDENVEIKDNTIIESGVKILNDCKIGANCILHSGVVIGADGFGFADNDGKERKKIPHLGNVIIEDNVEVGANTTIDRATLGSTIIRKGVKLDNLIQIAHNVEVGENTVLAAQSGIAGSTKLGKNCMVSGQVAISDHLIIANKVMIGGKSGVISNVKKEGEVLMGAPAISARDNLKSRVIFKKLPEIYKQVQMLEKELKELKSKIKES